MSEIKELDSVTIDKIAAGEVVERPVGAVKELVENSIDSGAGQITVEIQDGGIELIRVTDNGAGIPSDEVGLAFTRHATSKITAIDDLMSLASLGFRGEALSSIAAVARVELVTKTAEALSGTRYVIEGGKELLKEEVGAPTGTTIIVRDLFYNTPARAGFLKKPQTEGSYIAELLEHIALAHPEVSFRSIVNGTDRFHTSGNGDLKENIYRIYGRDIAANIMSFETTGDGVNISGYIGKPQINRSNRAQELFFVNGRYIRDKMLSAALEEGYRGYLMQRQFPFAVLNFDIPPSEVDVNVHPSKLEVRFSRSRAISGLLTLSVHDQLSNREMIPDALLSESAERREGLVFAELNDASRYGVLSSRDDTQQVHMFSEPFETAGRTEEKPVQRALAFGLEGGPTAMSDSAPEPGADERLLTGEGRREFKLLGQIFDTYWLIVFRDKLLIMDQHAAHEKVNYERMMRRWRDKDRLTQLMDPPEIIELTAGEEESLNRHINVFNELGFVIEPFGTRTVALSGVPLDIYGARGVKELFLEVLDELTEEQLPEREPKAITARIAGMACKASVKGNTRMLPDEIEALLDELLTLDEPYNCPHGRPTIITMSRFELDKRFHRIVG